MNNRLYVGNLPFGVGEAEIRNFFQGLGHLVEDATIITDRETGRSKGFGFVTLSANADPQRAISQTNGQDFQGRPLTVNEALPKESRSFAGGR
jgi:cold-inducible RNA-binding protein